MTPGMGTGKGDRTSHWHNCLALSPDTCVQQDAGSKQTQKLDNYCKTNLMRPRHEQVA